MSGPWRNTYSKAKESQEEDIQENEPEAAPPCEEVPPEVVQKVEEVLEEEGEMVHVEFDNPRPKWQL